MTALGSKDRRLLRECPAVIGVDEVGRGCLAGPVVVCATRFERIPDDEGVRDSKLMSVGQREAASRRLMAGDLSWVLCEVGVELIDRLNILEATRLAMRAAVLQLLSPGCVAVFDHVDVGEIGCRYLAPKKADREYFCVAASSILAKVYRDRILAGMGSRDPRWGWERNKGYGTAEHRRALQEWGPGPHHRKSFGWSPVLP